MMDSNNNFVATKKDLKYVVVKVPHLSKKLQIQFIKSDYVEDLIHKIETLINDCPINFGIYVRNKKEPLCRFVNQSAKIAEIVKSENKIFYMKKHRIFNSYSSFKKIKEINIAENQKMFIVHLMKNDVINVLNMLQQGLDPNFLLDDDSPLHQCVSHENAVVLMTILISYDAHVDYRTSENESVLHRAIKCSRQDIVKLLLDFGLSPDIVDSSNLTPLHYSIVNNNDTQCFKHLLEFNAKLNCFDNKGFNEIYQACYYNKVDHLKLLIKNREDIHLQSQNEGNTPLHYAVSGRAEDCLKFLLEIGACANIRNSQGVTPIEMADLQFPDLSSLFKISCPLPKEIQENNDETLLEENMGNINTEPNIVQNNINFPSNPTFDLELEQVKIETAKVFNKKETEICSKRSSTSISILESVPSRNDNETSDRDFFGIKTKIVEFKRTLEDGFGFSLESIITDKFVKLSRDRPSIHRICKWKVMSTTMTLFSTPFLLEVNNIAVGNMPHGQLVNLIKSIPNRITLCITNNFKMRSTAGSHTLSLSSRVSSIEKLDHKKPMYYNLNGICDEIIPELNSRSTDDDKYATPQFEHNDDLRQSPALSIDIYSPDAVLNPCFTNIVKRREIPFISDYLLSKNRLKSYPCLKKSEVFFSNDNNQKFPLTSNFDNSRVKETWISENSLNGNINRDVASADLETCFEKFSETPFKMHRSGIIIPLNKSKFHKTQIHIPLEIG